MTVGSPVYGRVGPFIPHSLAIKGPSPWADVRAYSATGDGTTDDTDAFQRAANALNAAGGGTLFAPAGTYRLGATTSVAATGDVVGTCVQLFSNTTMVASPGAVLKFLDGYTNPIMLTTRASATNVKFWDLMIDGNVSQAGSVSSGHAITLGIGASHVEIRGCWFYSLYNAAIGASDTSGYNATDISIIDNTIDGTSHGNGMYLSQMVRFVVMRNRLYNTYDDGIALISLRKNEATDNTDYCRDGGVSNNVLVNCAKATGSPIVITGERIVCDGNEIYQSLSTLGSDQSVGAIRIQASLADLVGPSASGWHSEKNGAVSIASSGTTVTAGAALFAAGDVGKTIYIPGAGAAGAILRTRITVYTDTTHVTVLTAASTTVSSVTGHVGRGEWAAVDVVCSNNQINNAGSNAINVIGDRIGLTGNLISTTLFGCGINVTRSEQTTYPTTLGDVTVRQNQIFATAKEGIKVGVSANKTTVGGMPGIILEQNTLKGAAQTGLSCITPTGTPLLSVIGNTVRAGASDGILIDGIATVIRCERNGSFSNAGTGIKMSSAASCTDGWFEDNKSAGNTTANWSINTTGIASFIPTLTEADLVSNVLDISKHKLWNITFSSAVTPGQDIVNFAAAEPGFKTTLKFTNGNAKITNANVRLKSGASITPTSNDTLSFSFDGTNWYEIGDEII